MRVNPITTNNNQNLKSKKQSFGSFIRMELPYSKIPNYYNNFSNVFSPKKVVTLATIVLEKIAHDINDLTGNKVNVYRRSLKDADNILAKYFACTYEEYARLLLIEDNKGQNKGELIKAAGYLLDKDIKFEINPTDLFAPRPKGIFPGLRPTNLEKAADGASFEDLIKM